jgi:hypothetical protein
MPRSFTFPNGVAAFAFAFCAQAPFAIAGESVDREGGAQADVSAPSDGLAITVYADPLGFALLGPTAGVEIGAGHFAGRAYGRWMNAGLLSQALFSNDSAHESLVFSYGAGLRGRYYLSPGGNGLFAGVGLEYLRARIEDTDEDREAYVSSFWIPHVDGGYRLLLGRLFLGAGAGLGYAIAGSTETVDLSGGEDPELLPVAKADKPYAAVSLDVGVTF